MRTAALLFVCATAFSSPTYAGPMARIYAKISGQNARAPEVEQMRLKLWDVQRRADVLKQQLTDGSFSLDVMAAHAIAGRALLTLVDVQRSGLIRGRRL